MRSNSTIDAMALTPNDRIVVAGTTGSCEVVQFDCKSTSVTMARYTRSGGIDGTFGGGDGVAVSTVPTGEMDAPIEIALDPQGGVVVAVYRRDAHTLYPPVLERFDKRGVRDMSFGGTGLAEFPGNLSLAGIAELADGKILALGSFYNPAEQGLDIGLYRFEADGRPDHSFGDDGAVYTPAVGPYQTSEPSDLLVQPDGKYLVLTSGGLDGGVSVFRFQPNGSLDSSFGSGGIALVENAQAEYSGAHAMTLDDEGRISLAIAGYDGASHGCTQRSLARLAPDGTLDSSFGTAGLMDYPEPFGCSYISAASAWPGSGLVTVGPGYAYASAPEAVLTGVQVDGVLDPTFGDGGGVAVRPPRASTRGTATAIQSNGRLVVAGSAGSWFDECVGGTLKLRGKQCDAFMLLGYNRDGTLDPTFGKGGITLTPEISACRLRKASGSLKLTGKHHRAAVLKLDYRAYHHVKLDVSERTAGERPATLFQIRLHKQRRIGKFQAKKRIEPEGLAELRSADQPLQIDLRSADEAGFCADDSTLTRRSDTRFVFP